MATLKDIAAALGVSVATVSNVFNGRPNVGCATRQKILRVAKQMEYRPNRAAQAMRTGRTRAIGLVLPDLTNPFFHARGGRRSGPQNIESAHQRREGFVKAVPRSIDIVWEVCVGFDGVLTPEALAALEQRGRATLIVAGNDLIAISAIRRLAEQGVSVPEEVSVTGFDNIRWTDIVTPRLTTIAQPVGAIGAKAVELMQERMSGEKIASRRTIFDVELIERDSVRQLNSGS